MKGRLAFLLFLKDTLNYDQIEGSAIGCSPV